MIVETLYSLSKDGVVLGVDEWSEKLGIIPMECCQYGEKIPIKNSRSVSASSYWTLGIKKTEDDSINSQVLKVLDMLYPKAKEINALIEEYGLDSGIGSFVWVDDDTEASDLDVYLEAETIRKLAGLQADFAVCIY
ncbi:MAG: DUF4279 domain-containing protein [Agarilytica sp.]